MLIEARATIRARPGKAVSALLLGFAPLITWLVFSLFYYGFPWPNTAYAKLGTGVPQFLLYYQGLGYFLSSLNLDPLTLLIIGVGFTVALLSKNRQHIAVAVGIGLYLLYIISIGGDFMSGRYFTIPFLCAVILLCRSDLISGSRSVVLSLGVVLVVGLTSPYPPIRSDQRYGQREETLDPRGIADERGYYFPTTGLLHACRTCMMPAHHWAQEGRASRGKYGAVQITPYVGMYGFYADHNKHLVDPLGLTDPLLARIPIPDPHNWRIGHFTRNIPPGYEETLSSGQNQIADPALAEYYNHLSLITRGKLFDFERVVDIWKMNTGQYNYLLPTAR
jgi:arabinofuranosyltransferase